MTLVNRFYDMAGNYSLLFVALILILDLSLILRDLSTSTLLGDKAGEVILGVH